METPLLDDRGEPAGSGAGGEAFAVRGGGGGSGGTLRLLEGGAVAYEPAADSSPTCCGAAGRWYARPQQIPGEVVVGAALESPNTLRIWYCPERRGLQKTPPLTCGSGQEAARLVAAVRREACYWGRGRPLRALAVVEPSAMRTFARRVLPLLEGAAGWEVLLAPVRLGVRGDAAAAAARADAGNVDVVVVAGCDEAFSDVLGSLLSRPDWRDAAARVALAHVPVPRRGRTARALTRLAAAAGRRLRGGERDGNGGGGGGSSGGEGVALAKGAGLADASAAAWALVKGSLAKRDVVSVLPAGGANGGGGGRGDGGGGSASGSGSGSGSGGRRFALMAVDGGGGILDAPCPLDIAWLPPATAPEPPAPLPSALAPAGSLAPAAGGTGCGGLVPGPPLELVRPFLSQARGSAAGSAGGGGSARGSLTGSVAAVALLPSGWCSRLQLPVHRVTLTLARPVAPAAAAVAAAGGGAGGAMGVVQLRVVCAPEGLGFSGRLRLLGELLAMRTGSASWRGSGGGSGSVAARARGSAGGDAGSGSGGGGGRGGGGGDGGGIGDEEGPRASRRELPMVLCEEVSAVALMPSGPGPSLATRLAADGMTPMGPPPAGATLIEAHPSLVTTTVWAPPPAKAAGPKRGRSRPGRGAG